MTFSNFLGVTGHKSESACQIYVDNSDVSKAKAADALSILPTGHPTVGESAPKKARIGSNENVVYNITINVGGNST